MGQTVPALRSQSGGNCHISGMQNKKHRSDTELLVAARTSSEPFAVFYERHFASVLAFFRRRVPGPEEAFDLAAETFAAALASLSRFEPGPAPPQAWLFAIARHKLSEARRSGCIQDEARRALSMQPIQLDDEAIEMLETTAETPAIESPRRSLPSSARRSRLTTSRSATTRKSQPRFAAQRVSFASA